MQKPYAMMDEYELELERQWLELAIKKSDNDTEIEELSEKLDEVNDRLEEIANPNLDDY